MIKTFFRGAALTAILALSAMAASIDGKWTGQAPGRGGEMRDAAYEFKADGATLTGKISGGRGDSEISEGKIEGDKFSFKVKMTRGDREIVQEYSGEVSGDEIKMKRKGGGGPNGPAEVDLTAKRAK